jgi:hypothetical protein
MILFRRVGSAFRGIEGREWALLALETLGVVAGILIAFELNEWASRRNEAARHAQLMERLFEESEMYVTGLRFIRDISIGYVNVEMKFADELARGGCPAPTQWDDVNSAQMLPALGAPTSVYQELTGAGGLASVELQTVRDALAQFHGNLDWTQRQVNYFRDSRIKVVEPSDPRVRVHFDLKADDPEVWTYDRAALCKDQGFRSRYAAATRHHYVYTGYVKELTDDAIVMCASLGASIGRTCEPRTGGPFNAQGGPLRLDDAALAKRTAEKVKQEQART